MPKAGWLPTMVPGAPAGWAELNRRFGTKSLAELFAPAISYAEEGYPVPVNVARSGSATAAALPRRWRRTPYRMNTGGRAL